MKLQVGQEIDKNRVRMDFRKSPSRPENSPVYEIEKDKADEFVTKYNRQEERLKRNTKWAAGLLALFGGGVGVWKHSWKVSILGFLGGGLVGFGMGALISSRKKNNLMDKYQVREYSVRSYF